MRHSGKKIILAMTFREFDGSYNDLIQRKCLESLLAQSYQNFCLVVTSFREKGAEAVIRSYGFESFFYAGNSSLQVSFTDVLKNALNHIEKNRSILMYSNADHIFPPHFLQSVIDYLPVMGSGTSFPQEIYANFSDFLAQTPLFSDGATKTIRRVPFPYVDPNLPMWMRADPNEWVPDVIFADGDLFWGEEWQDRLERYRLDGLWAGIAQNLLFNFVAAPDRRVNIFYRARYAEILNNYVPLNSVEEVIARIFPKAEVRRWLECRQNQRAAGKASKSYQSVRKKEFANTVDHIRTLYAFCDEMGISKDQYEDPYLSLNKLHQVSQYSVVGDDTEKDMFADYLNYWRLKYKFARNLNAIGGPVVASQYENQKLSGMWT